MIIDNMTTESILFRVNSKLALGELIGSGSFGNVHLVKHAHYKKKLAIKIATQDDEGVELDSRGFLFKEAKIMNELKDEPGFPRMKDYRSTTDLTYVVMNLLGPSVDNLFRSCCRKFSLKTGLLLMTQMLDRVESLHKHGLIHRDLKPDNFVIGSEDHPEALYLIDFGLAKVYRNQEGRHISMKDRGTLIGNVRFSSVDAHEGREQSRKDDLYSLGYIFVYLVKGKLPWMEVKSLTSEKRFEEVLECKKRTNIQDLCAGLPNPLVKYFEYLETLPFTEGPSYFYLKKLFTEYMDQHNLETDYAYDWVKVEGEMHRLPSEFKLLIEDLAYTVSKNIPQRKPSYVFSAMSLSTPQPLRLGKTISAETKERTEFRIKVRKPSANSPMSIGQESSHSQFISRFATSVCNEKPLASSTKNSSQDSDRIDIEEDNSLLEEGIDLESKLSNLTKSDMKPRKLSDISDYCRAKTMSEIKSNLFA